MKPRARSVYFSIFIVCFPQPAAPPLRHGYSIFIGFPPIALTFLNRSAVVAIIFQALRKCGHRVPKTEEADWQFQHGSGTGWNLLKKPDVASKASSDHRNLPLSRQRAHAGTAAARGPQPRPDPAFRPPLCHRK